MDKALASGSAADAASNSAMWSSTSRVDSWFAATAGCASSARRKQRLVDTPCTANSASARLALASTTPKSSDAVLTTSLASSESKATLVV